MVYYIVQAQKRELKDGFTCLNVRYVSMQAQKRELKVVFEYKVHRCLRWNKPKRGNWKNTIFPGMVNNIYASPKEGIERVNVNVIPLIDAETSPKEGIESSAVLGSSGSIAVPSPKEGIERAFSLTLISPKRKQAQKRELKVFCFVFSAWFFSPSPKEGIERINALYFKALNTSDKPKRGNWKNFIEKAIKRELALQAQKRELKVRISMASLPSNLKSSPKEGIERCYIHLRLIHPLFTSPKEGIESENIIFLISPTSKQAQKRELKDEPSRAWEMWHKCKPKRGNWKFIKSSLQ